MRTDWSQMNGNWVSMSDKEPPAPGQYWVTTSNLKEVPMNWNGSKWHLDDLDDWVVWWFYTPINGPLELI